MSETIQCIVQFILVRIAARQCRARSQDRGRQPLRHGRQRTVSASAKASSTREPRRCLLRRECPTSLIQGTKTTHACIFTVFQMDRTFQATLGSQV